MPYPKTTTNRRARCNHCDKFFAREELRSINAKFFAASPCPTLPEVVRLRFCPTCFQRMLEDCRRWEWRKDRDEFEVQEAGTNLTRVQVGEG